MLNTENTNEVEIEIRLYDNPMYGTTHGKGLYRKAIYNGSIDSLSPRVKYVIDMYNYDDWSNMAKTDEQMEIVNAFGKDDNIIYSWINRYDTSTKQKTLVDGFCSVDLQTLDMKAMIVDAAGGVTTSWKLSAKPCKSATHGKKSPQIFATNAKTIDSQKVHCATAQSSSAGLQTRLQAYFG